MSPGAGSLRLSRLSCGRRCTVVPVSSVRVYRFAGPYFLVLAKSNRRRGLVIHQCEGFGLPSTVRPYGLADH